MNNQLLTVREVLRRLQISRPTLHAITKEGKIKAVKIKSAVRYQESDVQEFIENAIKEFQKN